MDGVSHQTKGKGVVWLVKLRNKNILGACGDSEVVTDFSRRIINCMENHSGDSRFRINSSRHFSWNSLYTTFLKCKQVRLVSHRVRPLLGGQVVKNRAWRAVCPNFAETLICSYVAWLRGIRRSSRKWRKKVLSWIIFNHAPLGCS